MSNASDFITDDIIVLLVDDIDKYDGQWVDKEFEKDFDDEDELEEDVNNPTSNEKFIVSKEDLRKVLKNISSSNDINIISSKKNNKFQKDINLSKEDQIKIIKALSVEDYAYSTLSRNEIHKGSVLTIFFPKLELIVNGKNIKGLTMYIKIDDSVVGKIVVVSLHSGKDVKEHPSDFVIENGVLTKYTGPGGDVVIPDGVTEIGKSAFSGCEKLTLRAPAGSCAESYAKENKIPFEAI